MQPKTILLVEDNPDDEALTLRAFQKNNIRNRVDVARDGVAALDYLLGTDAAGKLRPLPEFVLLDLKLPKLDGIEVLQRLRAAPRTQCLPVIMLTSSTVESDLARSYQNGANSYVPKPIDFTEFVAAVRTLGLYWLVLNLQPPAKDE